MIAKLILTSFISFLAGGITGIIITNLFQQKTKDIKYENLER